MHNVHVASHICSQCFHCITSPGERSLKVLLDCVFFSRLEVLHIRDLLAQMGSWVCAVILKVLWQRWEGMFLKLYMGLISVLSSCTLYNVFSYAAPQFEWSAQRPEDMIAVVCNLPVRLRYPRECFSM